MPKHIIEIETDEDSCKPTKVIVDGEDITSEFQDVARGRVSEELAWGIEGVEETFLSIHYIAI